MSSSVVGIVQDMGSEVARKISPPTSQPCWQLVNRRQVDAGVGVLILFACLRRPNSIKDWLIRLSAHYKVGVSVEDFDILNGPQQDLVDDFVARKVLHMIDEQAFRRSSCHHFARRSLAFTRDLFAASQARTGMGGSTSQGRNWRQSSVKRRVRRLQHGAQRASELGVPWLVELPAEQSR